MHGDQVIIRIRSPEMITHDIHPSLVAEELVFVRDVPDHITEGREAVHCIGIIMFLLISRRLLLAEGIHSLVLAIQVENDIHHNVQFAGMLQHPFALLPERQGVA